MLTAVEMALQAGVPTKVHVLNLLHRLVDGRPISPPVVDAPQALSLAKEPQANVERYDALRQARQVGLIGQSAGRDHPAAPQHCAGLAVAR